MRMEIWILFAFFVHEEKKFEAEDRGPLAMHVHMGDHSTGMPPPLTLIVNIFTFFDRNGLEMLAKADDFVKRIVQKHFPSKPYYFMDDVTLEIFRCQDAMAIALTTPKESEDVNPANPSYHLTFNPHRNEWLDEGDCHSVEATRPYLNQFVRVQEAILFFDYVYAYTPEDMSILASLSHVWSGRSIWLLVTWDGNHSRLANDPNFRNNALTSIQNILSNDAIFSCRCLNLYDAAQLVSLQDYSRIYTVDVLLLQIFVCPIPLNIGALLALIERKSQFPKSKTVFVVDISTFDTRLTEVTDAICNSFSSSSTPFAFRLIILDDLENVPIEEFRLEKETTSEFLQLRQMSREESAKIDEACNIEEPEAYKKYVIERSRF
ncbi:hypothetical protein DdX_19950 [Ditylenchus destructor]|uniref:Uncharacterized protein n=1 Tax=Ditylenchus destructor TaxID=166010 RepID=A0AAD4MMA5_9BILA|nr:hypothetical protein DdX_19950 [Ditylenchus destructor]